MTHAPSSYRKLAPCRQVSEKIKLALINYTHINLLLISIDPSMVSCLISWPILTSLAAKAQRLSVEKLTMAFRKSRQRKQDLVVFVRFVINSSMPLKVQNLFNNWQSFTYIADTLLCPASSRIFLIQDL